MFSFSFYAILVKYDLIEVSVVVLVNMNIVKSGNALCTVKHQSVQARNHWNILSQWNTSKLFESKTHRLKQRWRAKLQTSSGMWLWCFQWSSNTVFPITPLHQVWHKRWSLNIIRPSLLNTPTTEYKFSLSCCRWILLNSVCNTELVSLSTQRKTLERSHRHFIVIHSEKKCWDLD